MYWQVQSQEKLVDFLSRIFHGTSRATQRSWLRHELIRVNARVVKQLDMELFVGDVVERLDPRPKPLDGAVVVYEDDHLLILDKPAGMLSVDTDERGKKNLFSLVKQRYGRESVFVIHRLDRETSGLIAFALSDLAEAELKSQLEKHVMQRRYMAVVYGSLQPEEGAWDYWVQEQKNLSVLVMPEGQGEETLTFYRTLQSRKISDDITLSLIEVELATGKKHQIRVSCAQSGHPIVGDDRYGGLRNKRLGLHAYALSLFHPVTGQSMEWISPSVGQFESWWQRCCPILNPPAHTRSQSKRENKGKRAIKGQTARQEKTRSK